MIRKVTLRVSQKTTSLLPSKEPVRLPLNIVQISFLKRISVRCLKSSSFYNAGSNNSKGVTRKSKNRIKENSGILESK